MESLLQKCTSILHGNQIQALLITTGQFNFLNICPPRSKLLELYSLSLNNLAFAIRTFSHIPNPSTNDWNAILRGLIVGPSPSDAFPWYRSMLRGSHKVDALTCSFVLKACARVLALSESIQLHSQIVRRGFIADALLGTTLLDLYAKGGEIRSARKVFDEMSKRDIASWNALISGLAQGEEPNEALSLFKRIGGDGFNPNEITVLGALSACSQLGAFKEGEKIHDYIRNHRLDRNAQVCNSVIDMYAKCGFVDKAYSVFKMMTCDKSLVTWNTMIMAFAMNGDGDKALELFHQMGTSGMNPDEHYGSVVDLLGRAGRLQQAFDVINSMPIVPDMVLWQTLLGACKTYRNVEMAETVTRKLVEMGSKSDGNFVLLSNIYASHERWGDVGRVRQVMKNKDVRKIPGFSYIEEKGEIHKFYNGDKSHDNWKKIYAKLEEIRFKMKEFGYVAETSFVLHDIGDEEKENALYQHSEKLAVAYGLVCANDEDGTPIQVIKNLRICGDCHVVMKLVSKMYNREIIVRDRVRFHRFKDGICSCRDYW
ncbi:Pentatricopeptide repeat-containing protein At1g34160 [Linum perenne]